MGSRLKIKNLFLGVIFLAAISITGCTQRNTLKDTSENKLQPKGSAICEVSYGEYENALEGDGILFEIEENYAQVIGYSVVEMADLVIPDYIKYEGNKYPVTAIGESALESDLALETVVIGMNVSAIGNSAFYACPELKKVIMSDAVLSIGEDAFGECAALKDIKWSSSLASLGDNCFRACEALEEIELPGSLTECGVGAFIDCIGLKKCTLGNGMTNIGEGMFTNCESLAELMLPDTLTSILPEALWNCCGLSELELPESLTTIGDRAFYSSGIKKLHMPYTVTGIKIDMINGMDEIETIEVPEQKKSAYEDAFANYPIKIETY